MKIIMPSCARWNDMRTLKSIPEEIHPDIDLIVQAKEYEKYKHFNCNIAVLPDHIQVYGKTIHWILSNYKGKICILDDDLAFAIRRIKGDYHIKGCNEEEVRTILREIDQQLDVYAHVGVSAREGNNRITDDYAENVRYMRVLAYNTSLWNDIDIDRYLNMDTFVDFDLNLQLLRKGLPSYVFFKYAQGHKSSNAPGGCSVHRTMDEQARCAGLLKAYHKEFVKLVTKKTL